MIWYQSLRDRLAMNSNLNHFSNSALTFSFKLLIELIHTQIWVRRHNESRKTLNFGRVPSPKNCQKLQIAQSSRPFKQNKCSRIYYPHKNVAYNQQTLIFLLFQNYAVHKKSVHWLFSLPLSYHFFTILFSSYFHVLNIQLKLIN